MPKYFIKCSVCVGEESTDIIEAVDFNDAQAQANDLAKENAESYGYEIYDGQAIDEYGEEFDIDFLVELYSPEKHNDLLLGGVYYGYPLAEV